jgi:hypothetical protein
MVRKRNKHMKTSAEENHFEKSLSDLIKKYFQVLAEYQNGTLPKNDLYPWAPNYVYIKLPKFPTTNEFMEYLKNNTNVLSQFDITLDFQVNPTVCTLQKKNAPLKLSKNGKIWAINSN